MELRLSNLNPATTPSDIRAHLMPCPVSHLSEIRTICNVGKTHSNTYCFIQIANQEQGEQAIRHYNGSTLLGVVIGVEKSQ